MSKNAICSGIILTLFIALIQTTGARGNEIYFIEHWAADFYVKQMMYWKKALAELPIQVAHLIAHGNAERLWHITSRH
jgi:hypothetical protein